MTLDEARKRLVDRIGVNVGDRDTQALDVVFTALRAVEKRRADEAHADDQMRAALERIARQHHTDHCIARQAWGDGECECESPAPASARTYEDGVRACLEVVRSEPIMPGPMPDEMNERFDAAVARSGGIAEPLRAIAASTRDSIAARVETLLSPAPAVAPVAAPLTEWPNLADGPERMVQFIPEHAPVAAQDHGTVTGSGYPPRPKPPPVVATKPVPIPHVTSPFVEPTPGEPYKPFDAEAALVAGRALAERWDSGPLVGLDIVHLLDVMRDAGRGPRPT